ncbi:MAG TPA: hypothetical protein VII06_09315 [Chloroflexota bacterium]
MADLLGSPEMPSAQAFRAFAAHLAAFRQTLPPDEQRILDALLAAAQYPEWRDDFESYWMQADGGPSPPNQSAPTPAALQAFGERLAALRQTLPTAQQPWLDSLLAVALRSGSRAAVTAFWAPVSQLPPAPAPAWYEDKRAAGWATTWWGRAWRNC